MHDVSSECVESELEVGVEFGMEFCDRPYRLSGVWEAEQRGGAKERERWR